MDYRLLIHDLDEADAAVLLNDLPIDVIVFPAKPRVKHCVGCFGCWIKTPGKCVITDRCADTPTILGACRELILISRCVYGGYSPEVKAVIDRSIGNSLPFFHIVHGEMHHPRRYDNALTLTVHFYGSMDEKERDLATRLVEANHRNLGTVAQQVCFHDGVSALEGVMA